MILYKPREMQRYVYYGTDQTEVYWVHFTGNNVKNILKEYHLFESGQIIQTGNSPEYHQIFRKMIQELQLTRPHYEEYLSLLPRELFLLISCQTPNGTSSQSRILQKEMEKATQYFNEHFTEEISIEEYVTSKHFSTSELKMQRRCFEPLPTRFLRQQPLLGMRIPYILVGYLKSRPVFHHLNLEITKQPLFKSKSIVFVSDKYIRFLFKHYCLYFGNSLGDSNASSPTLELLTHDTNIPFYLFNVNEISKNTL